MKNITTILIFLLLSLTIFGQETINVASFNLRMKTENDGINQWKYRVDHLKALIKYHEFDIFGTQEGFKTQLDDIGEAENLSYFGAGREDGKTGGEHSAIFYQNKKFNLLNHGNFWLSETPDIPGFGWDAACKRICTWGKLEHIQSGSIFYVFNVHFDHRGKTAQLESAKLIIKRINKIAGEGKVILTGDFNLEPESEGIQIIKKELQDSREISLRKPYGPTGTFNGFDLNRKLDRRIDYVFVSKGVQVITYASLSDTRDNRYPSDHLPVVVKIRLDNKSSLPGNNRK